MRIRNLFGFLALLIFTLWLYFVTIYNTYSSQWIFLTVFGFFIIGSFYAFYRVFKDETKGKNIKNVSLKTHGMDFLMVLFGAITTYIIHVYLDAGPVLSSGLVGILAGFFIKRYGVAIFCGSFVGMSSPLLLTFFPFVLASLLASVIFVLAKDVYNGYGGKLGTTALSGALITAIVLGEALESPLPFTLNEQLMILGVSTIAAIITYSISIRLKQGPVIASGLIGVVAGALLPLISLFGVTLAIVAFGASFVGMSSQKRLYDERFIAVAGILFGLIYIFSAPYFTGAGGKLGTIAFASTLSVGGIKMLYDKLPKKTQTC